MDIINAMTGADWVTILWWIGGGAIALAGMVLLIVALLGDCFRTRKTRPRRCPKCWYNLSGTESLKCSECGFEATSEAKLFKSRRRWRWALIALALILTGGGVIGWQQTRGYDWNRIKPVWLLKRQGYDHSARALAARSEILRRMTEGLVTQSQMDDLASHVLDLQRDASYPWFAANRGRMPNNWGSIIEYGHELGMVRDDLFREYEKAGHAPNFLVYVRRIIRQGEPLPIRYELTDRRVAVHFNRMIFAAVPLEYLIDGKPIEMTDRSSYPLTPNPGAPGDFDVAVQPDQMPELLLGEHIFESRWKFAVRPEGSAWPEISDEWQPINTADVAWNATYRHTFTVVDADSPTTRTVPDESLRETIRDAIQIELIGPNVGRYQVRDGLFLVEKVPVHLSFMVYCRVGDREELAGTLLVPNDFPVSTYPISPFFRSPRDLFPNATHVDIILRTDPRRAERTANVLEVWDGEIVFEDVPLRELQKGTITGNGPDS